MRVATAVAVLLAAIAMVCVVSVAAASSVPLEYSVDAGQTWQKKAELTVGVSPRSRRAVVKAEPAFSTWPKAAWQAAVKAGATPGSYLVRMMSGEDGTREVARVSLDACYMKGQEHISVVLGDDGRSPVGLRAVIDQEGRTCDPAVLSSDAAAPKHRLVVGEAAALKQDAPLPNLPVMRADGTGVGTGAAEPQQKASGEGQGGQQQGEERPKTFWEKYGTYVLIFLGVMVAQGMAAPQPEGQQGQQQGGQRPAPKS